MSQARRLPVVAVILVAANIAAAFAVAFDPELVGRFGFSPSHPTVGTVFSSMFMHQNLLHLLGNMVFLAAVGPAVEIAAGSGRFALVYFLGGLAGVLAHGLLAAPGGPPLIGASGAVASCAAYYSLRYVNLRVPVAPHLGASVAVLAGVWLALQAVGAFLHLGTTQGGTAFWAHLGGFAAGLILGVAFRAPSLARIELGYEVLREMNRRSPAAAAAAARQHLKEHPGDLAALRELSEALGHLGEHVEEGGALVQMMGALPENEQGPVVLQLDRIHELGQLPSLRRTMLAERLKGSQPEVARCLLDSVIRGPTNDPQRPDAMLSLVAMMRDAAPQPAQSLLDELMSAYPMHPAAELARTRGWTP